MSVFARIIIIAALLAISVPASAGERDTRLSHGISLFGNLEYPPDFPHFDYVDPTAPQGGRMRLAAIGSFDNLNPFILSGQSAQGAGLIYDTLLKASADEPGSSYGLIAEKVEYPADYSWVEFSLRKEARFHDGEPIGPEDVVFSFEALTEMGAPFYRFYWRNVESVSVTGPHKVRFDFDETGNRELPNIMGQLPVLPKHYWKGRAFAESTLEPPLGSGPYRFSDVKPGRSVSYERVPDYWGGALNVNVGYDNIGTLEFEYFRDQTVALEAFKAHAFDVRIETSAKDWATAYQFPAVEDGRVIKAEFETEQPQPMQAFILNTRRSKFADRRVRLAFNYAFDFEWANKNLFYGQYRRTDSYFENTEMEADGVPTGAELALLEGYREELPPEIFDEPFTLPKTDGSGSNRANLRIARRLLEEAGWDVVDGKLRNKTSGESLEVEFLLAQPAFERIVQPYARSLERLGITSSIRMVDTAQYQNRLDSFDFDIVVGGWSQSLSPGNEQRDFFSSAAADRPGSRNLPGIKNPVVDSLIDKVIFADDREALVAATRALDRVLLWGHYVVPQWHVPVERVAYWDIFGYPKPLPPYSLGLPEIWWVDPQKAQMIAGREEQASE